MLVAFDEGAGGAGSYRFYDWLEHSYDWSYGGGRRGVRPAPIIGSGEAGDFCRGVSAGGSGLRSHRGSRGIEQPEEINRRPDDAGNLRRYDGACRSRSPCIPSASAPLKTTTCRDCFVAEKRAEEAAAAALSSAAVAHLDLPLLTGTDRQISWASTIRTKRLAGITALCGVADYHACLQVTDAKWWIDHCDRTAIDLMAAATQAPDMQSATAVTESITDMPRTA